MSWKASVLVLLELPHGLQVIELDHDFGDTFSGVLTTSEGHMTALYANYNEQSGTEDIEEYCRGISVAVIKHWLNQVTPHSVPCCPTHTSLMSMLMAAVTQFHETFAKALRCLNSVVLHMLAYHVHDKVLTHAGAELPNAQVTDMLHIMLEAVLGMTGCLICT